MRSQTPPAPYRPDDWHWQIMSDLERDAYLVQVYDWLDKIGMDPRWLSELIGMAEWYQSYRREHILDPNWKRGGLDGGIRCA